MNFTIYSNFSKLPTVSNRFPLFRNSEKNRVGTDGMIRHAKCPKKNNLLANFYLSSSRFIQDPFLISSARSSNELNRLRGWKSNYEQAESLSRRFLFWERGTARCDYGNKAQPTFFYIARYDVLFHSLFPRLILSRNELSRNKETIFLAGLISNVVRNVRTMEMVKLRGKSLDCKEFAKSSRRQVLHSVWCSMQRIWGHF